MATIGTLLFSVMFLTIYVVEAGGPLLGFTKQSAE